jgi:hypothetical protein
MFAATAIYLLLAWWMNIPSVREMTALFAARAKPS